jgi:predicted flap endonuclease-1-like 5' DNA nuclease
MAFLIETFWLPLVLAGLIGVVIGRATCSHSPASWKSSWLPLAILVAIVGVYLAVEVVLPGRYGLWLETALMMFAVYLAGCCAACFAHSLMFGPPRAAERDPNAEIYARKLAGINSIADERRERERAMAATAAVEPGTVVVAPSAVRGVVPPLSPAPRNGQKDDLTLIWGVAEKLEQRMNRMGIWHFDQIAAWTPDHVRWFESEVEGFHGRIERDKWIEQCQKLATGWRPERNVGSRPKE